ncbi:MAG TPA: PRC-barrel domain-containing protein [Microvirga sp.]|jgi:sporulation protein YlmC with PRC-barrel domain|nr:PRC-barrel domain-containing protein [Microvirga sp.]
MLKRLLIAGLITGLAGPALAQSNAAPADGRFLSTMPADGMRLSKLRGVDVVGSDITRIGDIEDVLLSRDGTAAGVLIGVGGFLGIGEKSVAVPFDSILWNAEASPTQGAASSNTGTPGDGAMRTQMATQNDPRSPGVNTTGAIGARTNAGPDGTALPTNAGTVGGPGATAPGAGGAAGGSGAVPAGSPAAGGPGPLTPMARGTAGDDAGRSGMEVAMGGAAPAGSATVPVSDGKAPTRAMLRMTKQELQDAPAWNARR